MDVLSGCLSLLLLLSVSWGGEGLAEKRHATRGKIRSLFENHRLELAMENQKHSRVEEIVQQVSVALLKANYNDIFNGVSNL